MAKPNRSNYTVDQLGKLVDLQGNATKAYANIQENSKEFSHLEQFYQWIVIQILVAKYFNNEHGASQLVDLSYAVEQELIEEYTKGGSIETAQDTN